MKPYIWIIIAVLVLAAGGGTFWYFNRKKQMSTKNTETESDKTKSKSTGSLQVLAIQKKINAKLPANYISPSTGKNQIVEDGIWGPESQHALETVSGQKADEVNESAITAFVTTAQKNGKEGITKLIENSPALQLIAGLFA